MLGQISSARLLLRDVSVDDAQQLFELDQDPRVMRFLGGVRADDSVVRMRTLLADRVELYARTPGLGLGACFEQQSGAFIGWFMLRPRKYRPYAADGTLLAQTEDAELGYRLAHRFWGQGYATEMSRALVCHGLQQLALPQIVAFVEAEHQASVRVLQKAGLARVGRAHYADEDVELYCVESNCVESYGVESNCVESYGVERRKS
jgi:[ribosomal protein S5]-alanine N-acetyltransferase